MPLTLNNKLKSLKIGDYFWCKYAVTTPSAIGTFSDMGKKTDSEVASSLINASAPTNSPNGYFKFIVVDIKNGKAICVADRTIHQITWDNINYDGYMFGRQVKIDNNNESSIRYTLKSLGGGTASADTNTDWDKYVVNSTLNGNIIAGDINTWNTSMPSLTTSTTTTGNTYRALRGNPASSTFASVTSVSSYYYRPMLIIEKMFINKSFILTNGEYKKITKTTIQVLGDPVSTVATPIMTTNTAPSGRAFASTSFSTGYDAFKVFNQTNDTEGWCSVNGTVTGFVGYIFDTPKVIGRYIIKTNNTSPTQNPKNFTFEGSNDTTNGTDGTWAILDSKTEQIMTTGGVDWTYNINNSVGYKAYRVNISANNGLVNYCGLNELSLYERAIVNKDIVTLDTISTTLPNKNLFLSDGQSDLSVLDRKTTVLPTVDMGSSTTVGTGKQFSKTIDMNKYFDVRKIEIK